MVVQKILLELAIVIFKKNICLTVVSVGKR